MSAPPTSLDAIFGDLVIPPEFAGDAVYLVARKLAYVMEQVTEAQQFRDPEFTERIRSLIAELPDEPGPQLEALRHAEQRLIREAADAKGMADRATKLRRRHEAAAALLADMQSVILETVEAATGEAKVTTDRGSFWLQSSGRPRITLPDDVDSWPEAWRTVEFVTVPDKAKARRELVDLFEAGEALPEGFSVERNRHVRAE